MSFTLKEDFTRYDDDQQPYSIELEQNTNYSHHHGKVTAQGYALSCPGDKHLLKTPRLAGFTLSMNVLYKEPVSGFAQWGVVFAYDKTGRTGYELFLSYDAEKRALQFTLSKLHAVQKEEMAVRRLEQVFLDSERLYAFRMTVDKDGCSGGLDAYSFQFPLPGKSGHIGLIKGSSVREIVFSHLELSSGDDVQRVTVLPYREFIIPNDDGGMLPYRLGVSVDCCQGTFYTLHYTLSGGIGERPHKPVTVDCWIVQNDAFESPYIRLEGTCPSDNIYIKNGELIAFDPNGYPLTEEIHHAIHMPVSGSVAVSGFDSGCSLVFGYKNFRSFGCEYHAGARELLFSSEGELLYTGDSLRNDVICTVSSGRDKRIVGMIPRDIAQVEDALEHAINNHYFFQDEPIRFEIEAHCRYGTEFLRIQAYLENAFGERMAELAPCSLDCSDFLQPFGLCSARYQVSIDPLPLGVYHLAVAVYYGTELVKKHRSAFEVFDQASDESPQQASQLPFLYVGDGTPYDLENAYPNPWMRKRDFNIGHYIACAHFLPGPAEKKQVWRLLSLYRRKMLVWLTRRTIGQQTFTDYPGCIRHADYINCEYPGITDSVYNYCRYDLWRYGIYTKTVRGFLQDFLDANPDIAARLSFQNVTDEFTPEMLDELFDTCMHPWMTYAHGRIRELFCRQWEEIKRINPKARRMSYGPWPVYSAPYQGGYSVKWYGFAPQTLAEVFDGFLQYEDYPFSAGYGTYRGAWGIMTTKLLCEDIRIFPEIYESFYDGCPDGAVAYAYPPLGGSSCPYYFTVTQAFEAALASVYWKNGQFHYWRDYGFMMFPLHCQKPNERFSSLLSAWGQFVKNKPAEPLRCMAFVADFSDEDDRYDRKYHGDAHYNLCEAAEGYLYGCQREAGLPAGFVTDFKGLLELEPDRVDLLVLPSLAKAGQEVLEKIKHLYSGGVGLVATGTVDGLEELFGVCRRPSVASVSQLHARGVSENITPFEAEFHYAAADAAVLLHAGSADTPVLLKKGRALLLNTSIGHVGVDSFLNYSTMGRDNVSRLLRRVCKEELVALSSPVASVQDDCGIAVYLSENGETLILLTDYSRYDQRVVFTQEKRVTVTLHMPQAVTVDYLGENPEDICLHELKTGSTLAGFTVRIRPQQSLLFKLKCR